ncbi:MAG: bifunctional UDP-sugar hydrolase/5'-nucleotidase [Candidatus Polarisedimenticolia bacterium]
MNRARRWAAALLCAACAAAAAWGAPLKVLVTGDMHGWLEPQDRGARRVGGAAEMLARWKTAEGYVPASFLVLSAGDVATGPALATVYDGKPAVAAMNLMGYDVSALGNHEFDFGRAALDELRREARFPFVAANILGEDGKPAFPQFALIEEQGLKIGVVGLYTMQPHQASHFDGLTVEQYQPALRRAAAAARAAGAQVVIVLGHASQRDMRRLARETKDLGVALFVGGHTHEFRCERAWGGGAWFVNAGSNFGGYVRIDLDVDPKTGAADVLDVKAVEMVERADAPADPAVRAEISKWETRLAADYGEVVAFSARGVDDGWPVYNLVSDALLERVPAADAAIVNPHGVRQGLPPGPVTRGTVVSLLPFRNELRLVEIDGRRLASFLRRPKPGAVWGLGGLRWEGRRWLLAKSGAPLDPEARYKILVTNYMLESMDGLTGLTGELIAEDYRRPLYAWFAAHPTSPERPLESLVDPAPRVAP